MFYNLWFSNRFELNLSYEICEKRFLMVRVNSRNFKNHDVPFCVVFCKLSHPSYSHDKMLSLLYVLQKDVPV